MTQIGIEKNENEMSLCLTVIGHAGYAEAGRDIVCAAVSVLACVAAKVALECREDGAEVSVSVEEGDMRIYTRFGDKVAYERFLGQTRVVEAGYEMLAERYPEYVKFGNKA